MEDRDPRRDRRLGDAQDHGANLVRAGAELVGLRLFRDLHRRDRHEQLEVPLGKAPLDPLGDELRLPDELPLLVEHLHLVDHLLPGERRRDLRQRLALRLDGLVQVSLPAQLARQLLGLRLPRQEHVLHIGARELPHHQARERDEAHDEQDREHRRDRDVLPPQLPAAPAHGRHCTSPHPRPRRAPPVARAPGPGDNGRGSE